MSRLETPLIDRKLWATGDVLLHAELDLLLKDNAGFVDKLRIIFDGRPTGGAPYGNLIVEKQ